MTNDNKECMERVKRAIENGKLYNVKIYSDASGASFDIWDPTWNHGLPCEVELSFNIKDALEILKGHNFKSK